MMKYKVGDMLKMKNDSICVVVKADADLSVYEIQWLYHKNEYGLYPWQYTKRTLHREFKKLS